MFHFERSLEGLVVMVVVIEKVVVVVMVVLIEKVAMVVEVVVFVVVDLE
jgi:hypothetical protein